MQSVQVVRQDELPIYNYWNSLFDELNELDDERLYALEKIIRQKEIMTHAYNRWVKAEMLSEGDLIRKVFLPMEKKSSVYGKWSLT